MLLVLTTLRHTDLARVAEQGERPSDTPAHFRSISLMNLGRHVFNFVKRSS